MPCLPLGLLVFAWAAGFAAHVNAHAFLDHATPAVGSTVHTPPPLVKVWFTQQLEPAFSAVQVFDANGKRVDKADSRVDPADATLLVVTLPQLAPGTYRVTWRVLSIDSHVTEGDFNFDVAP
jgi:methionine-rich copper-binding protein CopC